MSSPSDQLVTAGASAPATANTQMLQYLTFRLGAEVFAISIQAIREIIEFPGLTTIPLTPGFLAGVINLRGAVVPVIDLSVRFGRGSTEISRRTCVVIVEIPTDEGLLPVGVIVDAVNEVVELEATQVEQRPNFGAGVRADFVAGMLRLHNQFVVALDLERVLSAEELEQLISATAGGGAN
ncbi:chemotaxis protein CheW [Niveibacterium sp. SC-1]|uniref:chemotaxis protein CheW n=1 Tax=Niveibacterium sp. SC-1 TaxID=3135646 RepID=UPI00311DD481